MPVKVKEFVIQAKFDDGKPIQRAEQENNAPSDASFGKKEIVDECVDKVLQHLKDQEER
jgi:hypothetical protein